MEPSGVRVLAPDNTTPTVHDRRVLVVLLDHDAPLGLSAIYSAEDGAGLLTSRQVNATGAPSGRARLSPEWLIGNGAAVAGNDAEYSESMRPRPPGPGCCRVSLG